MNSALPIVEILTGIVEPSFIINALFCNRLVPGTVKSLRIFSVTYVAFT